MVPCGSRLAGWPPKDFSSVRKVLDFRTSGVLAPHTQTPVRQVRTHGVQNATARVGFLFSSFSRNLLAVLRKGLGRLGNSLTSDMSRFLSKSDGQP